MKAWLIQCEGGREFVIYAKTQDGAARKFAACKVLSNVTFNVVPHDLYPTIASAIIDERKAPGA